MCMKRIILLVAIVLTSYVVVAQNMTLETRPERLFDQGKEMYLNENWTGAEDLLREYKSLGTERERLEEADFMIAVSMYRRGKNGSDEAMKEFLANHPESIHRNLFNFLIGSYNFNKKNWDEALVWFNKADLDYLPLSQQEDYSFRAGYAHMQVNNKDEATRYFGLLSQNSHKYRDVADFYLGHIEFSNGNYKAAMNRFERLRNNPKYEEEVAFYSAQATFFDGDIQQAINLAETFLNRYPKSRHSTEISRILGNSYYRLGQPSRAIPYYERYMTGVERPLRGDAYFMGLSYFETGKYNDAAKMFQRAVGEPDALSQNAQLQLGQTYLKLNQKQPAQMAFEAASRETFDMKARETSMFNYALLAHETNFSVFSESITLFENFLKEFPNSEYTNQVNDILAETFLTTKDYRAALNAIDRINNPGRRSQEAKQMVLLQLGAQEFINGNMTTAIQYLNNSIGMGNINIEARNNALYWRGEAYYRLGNFANATNDFRQFTQNANSSYENYALGWYNLGYALFKQQQYSQAVDAFEKYISTESNRRRDEYWDALNRIGDSYYFNRNFNDAERYYAQAADINPSSADYSAYQRAFVMGLQRNYQGKINALDNLMKQYPNSQYYDDAMYEKSRALTMLNREDEAIRVLQRLVSEFPRSPLASQGGVQLGQLYYNHGNFKQSIDAYKRVIANFPGSDDARNALMSMETVYRDMNDIQSYVDYANALPGGMRITPSKQDSLTYIAAEGVYMRGNRSDAESAMTKYLQSYPNGAYSSDAHYYLGIIQNEKGNKQEAMSHFRRVVDASSIRFLENALILTAQYEYDSANYQQALADYSQLANVARSASNKQAGQIGVVRSQTQLGNYHEAARVATDLLSGSGLSAETVIEARYLRAKAYLQVNEKSKAVEDLKFVANDTRSVYGAEAQFLLADYYYGSKQYDQAEAQVKDFMQKGTPHQYWMARALIVLSDTYLAKGDDFQANQYLESLRNNYKGTEEDIKQMINARLGN
jgi:TolA-binding protein